MMIVKAPDHYWWYRAVAPEGERLPWIALAAIDVRSGAVFVAAELADLPVSLVLLKSIFDGGEALIRENHTYVPAEWLAAEFTETAEICGNITARVRAQYQSERDREGGR